MSILNTPLDAEIIERMRELRYQDGYSAPATAAILGVSLSAVRKYTHGRPGKVPVAPLREAFLASGVDAGEVARRIGWVNERKTKTRHNWRPYADSSRVKRTLGILPDVNGRGNRSYRTMADAETVQRIAEAIGIGWWEVMPDE